MFIQITALYIACAAAGASIILGGIWLIYKQKIYIDSETKQPTEFDLPFFGKLKTNTPALGLFFFGCVLLIYPIHKSQTSYLHLQGSVVSQLHPVVVYAVVETRALENSGDFDLPMPALQAGNFTPEIVYVAGYPPIVATGQITAQMIKRGTVQLGKIQITGSQATAYQPDVIKPPAEFQH